MSLVVGTPMIRVDDGVRGTVEMSQAGEFGFTEARIVYYDRGERRVAGKTEKWVIEQTPGSKMRTEEMLLVAYAADRQLEAVDKHLPDRHWEPLAQRRAVHDFGLVSAIVAYLKGRQ